VRLELGGDAAHVTDVEGAVDISGNKTLVFLSFRLQPTRVARYALADAAERQSILTKRSNLRSERTCCVCCQDPKCRVLSRQIKMQQAGNYEQVIPRSLWQAKAHATQKLYPLFTSWVLRVE
jgi:hypothetical protein